MGRESFREDGPAHPLALEIHLGHEVRCSLLGHSEARPLACELNLTGSRDNVDGCLEERRFGQLHLLGLGRAFDHDDFHAALRRAPQHQFVHETPNHEDAASA